MPRRTELGDVPEAAAPWTVAALIHAACIVAWALAAAAAPELVTPGVGSWLEGLCAAAFGARAGLPRWWLPINLLLVPAARALLALQLPPELFLAAFCALVLVNVGAWRSRVPLYLTSAKAAALLLDLLPQRAGFSFIDLGCGTGSLLTRLARARPDGSYAGVELAPVPFLISLWRASRNAALRVRWGDFWLADLAHYHVVYAYLSPVPMAKLWRKARREMQPGSLFVSNGFCVPGVEPVQTISVGDHVRSTLYVWRM
jgi:hypothetical protein